MPTLENMTPVAGFAPKLNIAKNLPAKILDASQCESAMQLAIFFDGTGNNVDVDIAKLCHSNIARLHKCYPNKPTLGLYKSYIPGVGTPFPEIGEMKASTMGSAFGIGGRARLIYGLTWIMNMISMQAFSKNWFMADEVIALCKSESLSRMERKLLLEMGTANLTNDSGTLWRIFFQSRARTLNSALATARRPVLKECVLDVFGFSRGAAEARVFCNWFLALTEQGQFAGIPVRIRFLGLFDTVASVGKWEGVAGAVVGTTGGHGDWAVSKDLRIPAEVENCVHMVAMHELRRNFPLDEVTVDGVLPPNCTEVAYPGTHSDIGGGYAPGELGIAFDPDPVKGDALKLSQIPLNHMFECACVAGVPLSKELDRQSFAVSPVLERAYRQFLACSPSAPQRISDWMLPYLVWRWQQRKNYAKLDHVRNANEADRKHLLEANATFVFDGERMRLFGDDVISEQYVSDARAGKLDMRNNSPRQKEINYLEAEAWEVRKRVLAAHPIAPELGAFFDNYVHDSLAGFRKEFAESTGHWRYRRKFQGYDQPLLSQNTSKDAKAA